MTALRIPRCGLYPPWSYRGASRCESIPHAIQSQTGIMGVCVIRQYVLVLAILVHDNTDEQSSLSSSKLLEAA